MHKRLVGLLFFSFLFGVFSSLHLEEQSREISYLGYDESVYYSLARNALETSLFNYTLNGAHLYLNEYRTWYLERPIFHHPPLFVWLFAFSQMFFGTSLLVGRLLNVLLGTLSVYVVYLIARQLSKDEQVALTSGFFLAVSALHIQLSSLVLIDMLLTLYVSLFVLSTLQLAEEGIRKRAIQAGFFLGFALLTKYPAILALPILGIYVANRRINFLHATIVLGVALALNSWWLLWNLKVYSLSFIADYREFWRTPNVAVPTYAYFYFLPVIAPAAILGYFGVVLAIWKKDLDSLGISLVILAYLGFFTALPLKEMRFILPALPLLLALGCSWLFKMPSRSRNLLIAILTLLSLASTYIVINGGYFWYLPLWHF
jgi:4-amino-4-deoxy-L-arabinose transferase-like glycosyltransferase